MSKTDYYLVVIPAIKEEHLEINVNSSDAYNLQSVFDWTHSIHNNVHKFTFQTAFI